MLPHAVESKLSVPITSVGFMSIRPYLSSKHTSCLLHHASTSGVWRPQLKSGRKLQSQLEGYLDKNDLKSSRADLMEDIKDGLAEIFPAADLLNAFHILASNSDRTLKSLPEVKSLGKLEISLKLEHVGKGSQLFKSGGQAAEAANR